jgi:hypothetical protein
MSGVAATPALDAGEENDDFGGFEDSSSAPTQPANTPAIAPLEEDDGFGDFEDSGEPAPAAPPAPAPPAVVPAAVVPGNAEAILSLTGNALKEAVADSWAQAFGSQVRCPQRTPVRLRCRTLLSLVANTQCTAHVRCAAVMNGGINALALFPFAPGPAVTAG